MCIKKIRKIFIPLAIYSNTWNYFSAYLFFTRGSNHKFFLFLVCNFLISFFLLVLTSVWMEIYIHYESSCFWMLGNLCSFPYWRFISLFVLLKNCNEIFSAKIANWAHFLGYNQQSCPLYSHKWMTLESFKLELNN